LGATGPTAFFTAEERLADERRFGEERAPFGEVDAHWAGSIEAMMCSCVPECHGQ